MTSLVGLSTYAYFWQMSDQAPTPMALDDALRDVAGRNVALFQICDHAPLDTASDQRLREIRTLADQLGIELEIGTRGTGPDHLLRYLHIAKVLGAQLIRSMWSSPGDHPNNAETARRLRSALPHLEAAGVTLALETYEQVPTPQLVSVVTEINSPNIGICLDPANTVANLEHPTDVVDRCAPYTKNWHIKDFGFTRSPGWVGFHYTGMPIGTGRLDYTAIEAAIDPHGRNINRVIEFWLPQQAAADAHSAAQATIQTERAWIAAALDYLRRHDDH